MIGQKDGAHPAKMMVIPSASMDIVHYVDNLDGRAAVNRETQSSR